MVNLVLIGLSVLSGHVIIGGMTGICWAVLNIMILLEAKGLAPLDEDAAVRTRGISRGGRH